MVDKGPLVSTPSSVRPPQVISPDLGGFMPSFTPSGTQPVYPSAVHWIGVTATW